VAERGDVLVFLSGMADILAVEDGRRAGGGRGPVDADGACMYACMRVR